MMWDWLSFFVGVGAGVVLLLVAIVILGLVLYVGEIKAHGPHMLDERVSLEDLPGEDTR